MELNKDLIYIINKFNFSGVLYRIPSVNGFRFGGYISLKILPMLRHMLTHFVLYDGCSDLKVICFL